MSKLLIAAKRLRNAQRAYMADRGNEDLGRQVGEAAALLDVAIDEEEEMEAALDLTDDED